MLIDVNSRKLNEKVLIETLPNDLSGLNSPRCSLETTRTCMQRIQTYSVVTAHLTTYL